MKSLKLLIFAALAIFFFACSSPAGSDANSTTVTNGTQNHTSAPTPTSNPNGNENGNENQNGGENNQEVNNGNENGGSSTTLAPNECDMGGDFNLEDWVGKIYVNNQLPQSTHYSNVYKKINWDSDAFETNSNHKVHLYITKNENKLIVEKNRAYSGNNQWFEIQSVVKTSDNRIDVTLKNAN